MGARAGASVRSVAAPAEPDSLHLVRRLADALAAEGIRCCAWKSTAALDRALRGESDLDLLVAREDADRFERILASLGFKRAWVPGRADPPGTFHAYGLDEPSGVLVPLHVHYQLVVGDDTTKNLRLPFEEAYLASAEPGPVLPVPAPGFELVAFVLRMVLKHATWDALLAGKGALSAGEERELAHLSARADPEEARRAILEHLPCVGGALWERCRRCLEPGATRRSRIRTAWQLERALAAHGRRSARLDAPLRLWRRVVRAVRRRLGGSGGPRARLVRGGAWIAIVGADGAGKTTAARDLHRWLSPRVDARLVHLGKPPRSGASALLHRLWRAVVRPVARPESARRDRGDPASPAGNRTPGPVAPIPDGERIAPRDLARLVRKVLVSRDRYLSCVRGSRFVRRGGVVVSDRFPLPRIRSMDGPATATLPRLRARSRLVRALARLEDRYYRRIGPPDVLLVLRVPPEVAVERRRGLEPEEEVRRRAEEIWSLDWSGLPAVVLDATRPLEEVLRQIRSAVWARL
ncbi:MAG TPA: nucleotidyltransferase family protein [Actinomycetota bacterium]|nr:nucleotidyltransferase family protein [Actinomycetota bacterium]